MKPLKNEEVKLVRKSFIVATCNKSFLTTVDVPIEGDILDIVYNKVDTYLKKTNSGIAQPFDIIELDTLRHTNID